jgi:glycosyltransferase involved in cell wall biosynthesis
LVFTSHTRQWTFNERARIQAPGELREHKEAYKAADARILISIQAKTAAARSPDLAPLECHVISNGVDVQQYQPPAEKRRGRIVLGVGLIDPVKRWHLVAQAIQGTTWSLELVGPVGDVRYAEELRALPGVRLLGELDEAGLLAAYHRARIIAHPSEAEA